MPIIIGILCLLGIAALVFYKTVLTREWRDQPPAEEDGWHWLFFYYDPEDRRLFVPKRMGLGWTINFAQPSAIIIITLLVVALIAFRSY